MRREDSGAVAIIVALFAVVLFGFGALVVDIGQLADVRSQNQRAADASAIAGVTSLAKSNGAMTPADLTALVQRYVKSNAGIDAASWAGCADSTPLAHLADTGDPSDRCISYALPSDPGGSAWKVRVKLPDRRVPATFAGLFGVGSVTVAPAAVADAGQPPQSPCLPCDPRIDDSTLQPVSSPTIPSGITLPDPASVPPAPPLDPTTGCPTGPGRYDADLTVDACVLQPGLYLFDGSTFKVDGAVSTAPGPNGEGVTLVFYGTASPTLDVEGSINLIATPQTQAPLANEIPGVAVIIAQPDSSNVPRRFELGGSFDISGSLFAVGDTTWTTDATNCAPTQCRLDNGVLAVAKTGFASGVPFVDSNTPAPPPPPEPPHLAE
jgi:hypothetical protein